MADEGQKGAQLLEEAQKKLKNSQGLFSSFFSDAAKCFKKIDPSHAISCLEKTIEIYRDMGRFSQMAKNHISIAEIYELELVDFEKTILHYRTAADYFQGEEAKVSANKCLLKVAQYSALNGNFQNSAEIYEEVAGGCIESPLLKYSAKEHYFRAALCHMCVDVLNAENAIKKYQDVFPQFTESRECKFLKTLISKIEENDIDGYTQTIQDYDSISPLDSWFTNLLLRVKQNIETEPDLK
ncbi:soluble NSF attachment protein-like protein [Sarcoptes scabiei]|uniref:Soluble NSF attachment protein-like protein n=1 Tax=Sarcoptes scabiei TaxID=52283 RepID=A0A132AE95_SARSC|nr:soluble NSF attachment protein-like protein [Sarcoptes scabiei]